MPDKFIIHGATFNGNGTTSAAATSNGGVGAWNSINVLEGTAPAFGTLAAGDTVYIRSKDAAGADITRTMTASISLGNAAATAVAYINWVLDNGAVWPGVDGTLTYTNASGWTLTVRIYNRVVSRRKSALVIRNTSVNQGAGMTLLSLLGDLFNPRLDWSSKTGSGECIAVALGDNSHLESADVLWGAVGGSPGDTRGLFAMASNSTGKVTLVDPVITLSNATVGMPLFFSGGGSARNQITVLGGEIKGPGATTGQPLYRPQNPACRFRSIGLRIPRTVDVVLPSVIGTLVSPGEVELIGCDDGVGGHIEREWGYATSRTDSNPPTLNATLPDASASPWSWRVYPKTVSNINPMALTSVKMFTGAAAVKTITQEVLVADTMAPNKGTLWITVEYTDNATGVAMHATTRDWAGTALDASTAGWSATVWGAVSFNKRKLELATPTAIKPNTPVTVTLWGLVASASANDIYFVDPDFGVI
jgi:hypothetical protein